MHLSEPEQIAFESQFAISLRLSRASTGYRYQKPLGTPPDVSSRPNPSRSSKASDTSCLHSPSIQEWSHLDQWGM